MNHNRLLVLFLFSLAFHPLHKAPATENLPLGPRSAGLGNSSVSLSDTWSTQNNQAGLGFIKNTSCGISYQNQFLLKELSTKAISATHPVKGGTWGLCISHFGSSLYSENKAALSFGKSFGGKIAAGISLDYFGTSISEYGKKTSFVAEAGLQAKPIKDLTLGVHLFNLTRTKLADYNDERMPAILRAGFDYRFSEKVFMTMETEKDIEKKGMVKAGIEYKPIHTFYLRAGISTHPSMSCFGIGIDLSRFKLDLSSTYHSTLGFSPHLGLICQFERNAKTATSQSFK